jgi:hypothetical protein
MELTREMTVKARRKVPRTTLKKILLVMNTPVPQPQHKEGNLKNKNIKV